MIILILQNSPKVFSYLEVFLSYIKYLSVISQFTQQKSLCTSLTLTEYCGYLPKSIITVRGIKYTS